jgi:hypothetical protein
MKRAEWEWWRIRHLSTMDISSMTGSTERVHWLIRDIRATKGPFKMGKSKVRDTGLNIKGEERHWNISVSSRRAISTKRVWSYMKIMTNTKASFMRVSAKAMEYTPTATGTCTRASGTMMLKTTKTPPSYLSQATPSQAVSRRASIMGRANSSSLFKTSIMKGTTLTTWCTAMECWRRTESFTSASFARTKRRARQK